MDCAACSSFGLRVDICHADWGGASARENSVDEEVWNQKNKKVMRNEWSILMKVLLEVLNGV